MVGLTIIIIINVFVRPWNYLCNALGPFLDTIGKIKKSFFLFIWLLITLHCYLLAAKFRCTYHDENHALHARPKIVFLFVFPHAMCM